MAEFEADFNWFNPPTMAQNREFLCGDIFSSTFVTSGIISELRCITFRMAQMRLAGGVWRFWTISHGTSNLEHRSLVKLVWISLQTLLSVPYPMLPCLEPRRRHVRWCSLPPAVAEVSGEERLNRVAGGT